MMIDKHAHFRVIPRYSASRIIDGNIFDDKDLPGLPDIT